MPPRRSFRDTYSPPRRNSARAVADCTLYLCGARIIDHLHPEWLGQRFSLSPKQAELLLVQERMRRARNGQ